MLIETLIITILILALVKKNIRWLYDLNFSGIGLVFLAFIMESILNIGSNSELDSIVKWIVDYTLYFHTAIYFLLFLFIWKNRKLKGMCIIALGFLLNFIVIFVNEGFMPVDIKMGLKYNFEQALYNLQHNYLFGHNVLTEISELRLLADIINIPPPYFWPKTISIGDIFIDLGIIILLISTCFSNEKDFEENLERKKDIACLHRR